MFISKYYLGIYRTAETTTGVLLQLQRGQLKLMETKVMSAQVEEFIANAFEHHGKYKYRCKVNLAVSGEFCVNRLIIMPLLPAAQLAEAVKWEINPYLDPGAGEISFDHLVVSQFNGEPATQQVYVAGMPKLLVEKLVEVVREQRLIPWRVETKWATLFRLWQLLKVDADILLVLDSRLKGDFVVYSPEQGFLIRQFSLIQEESELREELKIIDSFLTDKYHSELVRVLTVGGHHQVEAILTDMGKEVSHLAFDQMLSQLQITGTKELGWKEGLVTALGLALSDVKVGGHLE